MRRIETAHFRLKIGAPSHNRMLMPDRTQPGDTPLDRYAAIADAIAALFKPRVEVVIHDLSTNEIAHIAGNFSRRRAGDSSLGDRFDDASLEQNVIGPYRKVNPDGRNLRSITAVLRDGDRPIGMMCINFDVSLLERLGEQIASLAFLPGTLEPHAPFFHDNWRQSLERNVTAFEAQVGVAASAMDTPTRRALIRKIDSAGLLTVRHAPTALADRLGMSRAALYKHLKVVRNEPEASSIDKGR